MSSVKMLIGDYTRAVTEYHRTDPALISRRSHLAYRAASVALALALRSPEYTPVWTERSKAWEQRMQPYAEAVA
jgi:hypothetical protein